MYGQHRSDLVGYLKKERKTESGEAVGKAWGGGSWFWEGCGEEW